MKFKKERKYLWFIFVFLSLISTFLGIKINEQFNFQAIKEDNNNLLFQFPKLAAGNEYYKELVLNKTGISLILKYSNFKRNKYILTIFGNSLTNFDITAYDERTYEQIDLPIKKLFYNGYAIIIDRNIFPKENNIRLELNLQEQFIAELIYIRMRRFKDYNFYIKENIHYDIILNEDIEEDCFYFDLRYNKHRYSFEFLTYTKNIKVSLWKNNKYDEIKINDESMALVIENKYDEICFNLDNNEIEGSISLEIIDLDSSTDLYEEDLDNIMIYNNFTLIRGFSTHHYLPRGHGLVHRTKDFLFKDRFSLQNIKFRKIKGNSKLIIDKCVHYPDCNFYIQDLDFAEYKYENINGYISVKKYLDNDYKNYIAVVYCPEDENLNEDCEYEIEMKNENEATYLYEKQLSYSYVNLYGDEFKKEDFIISVGKEFTQNDELYIYFNLFSGNAKIQFFNLKDVNIEDYRISNLGNVKLYIFQKNVIDENPEIYIKVIRDQNAYFSVSYEIKNIQIQNQYFIEEGILNYEKVLSNSENIYITNFYKKNNYYPFIININTFGNDFEIIDIEGKANIKEYPDFNLIQIILDKKVEIGDEEKQYSLGIKRKGDIIKENEEKQYFYNIIGFNENTKILINNGQTYINHLNEFNKEATFVYTFSKRDNDDNKLVINFRKYSKNIVKININFGENGNTDYFIKRLSRIIILNNNEINQTCNYLNSEEGENECKIIIKVTSENEDEYAITDDPSTHIDFSIQIYGNDEPLNPIFLPQNTFISNLLLPNFKVTYLVDIPQYGEGKIYVDFMEGGGKASAKLKNKKTKTEEIINFDYFNKYFDILNEKTKNCEEEDCEVIIELITYDKIYKYNIYSKLTRNEDKEKIAFLVPEYEYIYGNLKGNQADFYKTKISKDTDHLIINIYCDNCYVNYLLGEKKYQVDSSLEKEIIICNENSGNLYGETFYFNIKIKDNNLTKEQNYNLRIISPGINLPVIIPMTSLRNEHCKINETSPCYFIIPLEQYNKIDKIRIFVPDNDNVRISHNTLDYDSYYRKEEEEIYDSMQYELKKKDEDMFQNNYYECKISRKGDNFEKIYMIKIELNYSANITVISSHYNIMDYENINPILNDYNLISLKDTEKMSISLNNKGFYDIGINLIKGIGTINYKNNLDEPTSYLLDYKVQENINLLLDSEENNKKIIEILRNEDKNEFITYFRILLKENNINLAELSFQKNNYFDYLYNNRYSSIWPLNFYMKINFTSVDSDSNNNLDLKNINLNYKFSKLDKDITTKNIIDFDKEKFDIKVYLVDSSFINKRKLTQNNHEYLSDNINSISDYRIDITSGFSLIEAKNIIQKITNLEQEFFLYILISPQENFNNNNIRLVFSTFDLSYNCFLPKNEYLELSINQEAKIGLGRNLEYYLNSEIEFVLNNTNFNFTIISQNNEEYYMNDTSIFVKKDEVHYGKTIINKKFLDNEKNNLLFVFNNLDNIKNAFTNIFIKYKISEDENILKYFEIEDGNVNIDNFSNRNYIIFKGIKENKILDTKINEETIIIYNIRIYDYTDNFNEFSNNIFNNETPIKIIKIKETSNNEIHEQINEIGIGKFYISILAEARKGNIYEYFTYNPYEFLNSSECAIIDININENESFTIGRYSKSYIYRAKVDGSNGDFIKLNIKHNNISKENNYIYVSSEKSFEKVKYKELYKYSEYKNIERDSALIIPVDESKLNLIIRIPCNEICNYTFYYKVYKKNESIKINSDECFDFNINNKYNFIYSNEDYNNKISLLTMTGYSIEKFLVSNEENKLIFDETYFNGYSSIINDNKAEFSINKYEKNLMVKICHRTLSDKNSHQYNIKNIFVGDKIYTRIEENNEECFKINKPTKTGFITYLLTFITKSNSVHLKLNNSNNNFAEEEFDINGESENIIFNSTYNQFCIKKNNMTFDDYNEDIGIFINLLSNENDKLNMSLIKGVSTKQILSKNSFIYYRIDEYSPKSNSINIRFQKISGETEVSLINCSDYPYCKFSENKALNEYNINNNIYYKINIENEDNIYHKSELPMIKVDCIGGEYENYCSFYIEMANNDDNILLYKNKKIYSLIQTKDERQKYKFSLSKSEIKKDSKKQLFIQLYSLTGNNNLIVNGEEVGSTSEKYYKYNNNTIFYLYDFSNNNKDEFNIEIEGEKNSYYNLIYYTISEENENENNIYLTTGEAHYNIITKNNITYNYYFQESSISNNKDPYLVNINGINCILSIKQEAIGISGKNRTFQFILDKKNEKIIISNEMDDICEFTISAIELSSSKANNLILNNGVSQIYKFGGKINSFSFNYLILKEDLTNKNILININKNTLRYLMMDIEINGEPVFRNKTLHNNNEIFELKEIINYEKINSLLYENNNEKTNDLIIIKLNLYVQRVEHFDFRIKISPINLPSFLYKEEIEYGYIKKNENVYYYLDYKKNEELQIFFDVKGNASFKVSSIIDKYNDKNALKYNNIIRNDFNFVNPKTNTNYINIGNCSSNYCQVYIKIYISGEHNNNISLFSLYTHSNNTKLNVPKNRNIYGVLSKKNEQHIFYTLINLQKDDKIKIVLNCKKCVMCYYYNENNEELNDPKKKCRNPLDPSKEKYFLIQNDRNIIEKIYYKIFLEETYEKDTYSIYILDLNSPKFITQSVPEVCKTPCKFLLPLYQYYTYNERNIILFVPDDEQTVIYGKVEKMHDDEGFRFDDIKKSYNFSSTTQSLISNKLDLNLDEIKVYFNGSEDLYIKIQIESKIKSEEEKNITFIINKFYNSLATEINPPLQNIFIINDSFGKTDILNSLIKDNNIYKIDINLIEGSGQFSLSNNKQNINYSLDYDTQDRISLILKNNSLNLKPEKTKKEEKFIFYMDIIRKQKKEDRDELIFRKTNYFKYFKEDGENDTFPIYLKLNLDNVNKKNLHINLHFSNLVKLNPDNYNGNLFNVTDEKFNFTVNIFDKENKNSNDNIYYKYYNDLRRGYIYIDYKLIEDKKYLELIIDKNKDNKNIYKSVSLDITPFDINENIELPRNNYLEMKINTTYGKFKLSKPLKEYNNLYLELSTNSNNNYDLSFNPSYFKEETNYGKSLYSIINNNDDDYTMKINLNNNNQNILIKYMVKRENITNMNINKTNIFISKLTDETYSLSYDNILPEVANINGNYKINYFVRLYKAFDFEENEEPKNIYVEEEPILSFKKELNNNELKNETISYELNLGKLKRNKYFISVLGEVVNDTNVEYFAYNYSEFSIKNTISEPKFDFTWIIIIIILLSILIFGAYYLFKQCIHVKNKSRGKDYNINSKEEPFGIIN